jgi:hypothetical protein
MGKSLLIESATLFLFAPLAYGADSFRLENGQLLEKGLSKAEVLDLAGKPEMKDVTRKPIGKALKKAIWTFYLNDTFGNPSVVSVTFEGDKVTRIKAKARKSP